MPVDRADKKFDCLFPGCNKTFGRPYDLERHGKVHCVYEDREFGCPYPGCGFRANQQGGLKCHVNSIHENLRMPCGETGCTKTFSDPSSLSKHKQKCHRTAEEASGSWQRVRGRKRNHSAAYPVSVHTRVARHVEEHSRQDAKNILGQFATFAIHSSGPSNPATPSDDAPSDPDARQSASHGALSAPSSLFVFRPNYTRQPSPCELPGVIHRANDVPTDSWSNDNENQIEHQAYDANPQAAPTVWGYYPDVPVLSRPQVPTSDQPSHIGSAPVDLDLPHTGHDQSCRCWDCVIGDSLTLAPLRGQYEGDRGQGEGPIPNEATFPFSYRGAGHVPPSDHQWIHPPNDFSSSAYPRPYSRMLFDIR